jgi:DNA-binding XRE family transcriptional regulator
VFPHDEHVAKGDELQRIGRAVAARRGELGMTQQELAGTAHVDLKTIYNLESGTRWPIARTRVAISAALGWQGDALAALRDSPAGRSGVGPLLAVVPPPGGKPEPLDGLPLDEAAALAPLEAAITERAAVARERNPGRKITGSDLFPTPGDIRAPLWDALARALREMLPDEDVTDKRVAQLMAAELSVREHGGGRAAGLRLA